MEVPLGSAARVESAGDDQHVRVVERSGHTPGVPRQLDVRVDHEQDVDIEQRRTAIGCGGVAQVGRGVDVAHAWPVADPGGLRIGGVVDDHDVGVGRHGPEQAPDRAGGAERHDDDAERELDVVGRVRGHGITGRAGGFGRA